MHPATLTPALYDAVVTHARREQIQRAFTHRIYLWLVDLDALPRLPRWLIPFARFQAADHLGDPGRSIRENLDPGSAARASTCTAGGSSCSPAPAV